MCLESLRWRLLRAAALGLGEQTVGLEEIVRVGPGAVVVGELAAEEQGAGAGFAGDAKHEAAIAEGAAFKLEKICRRALMNSRWAKPAKP